MTEDEIDLFDATRFELVRHSEGEPLQLGFARELPQQQIDFLLSGVQVRAGAAGRWARGWVVGGGGTGAGSSRGSRAVTPALLCPVAPHPPVSCQQNPSPPRSLEPPSLCEPPLRAPAPPPPGR